MGTDIECPRCGKSVYLQEGETAIECPFCGYQFPHSTKVVNREERQLRIEEAKTKIHSILEECGVGLEELLADSNPDGGATFTSATSHVPSVPRYPKVGVPRYTESDMKKAEERGMQKESDRRDRWARWPLYVALVAGLVGGVIGATEGGIIGFGVGAALGFVITLVVLAWLC